MNKALVLIRVLTHLQAVREHTFLVELDLVGCVDLTINHILLSDQFTDIASGYS